MYQPKWITVILVIFNIVFSISYSYSQQDIPTIPKGQLHQIPIIVRSIKTTSLDVVTGENVVFKENFESKIDLWSKTGSYSIGVPQKTLKSGYNSLSCAATNLTNNYPDNADSWLISPLISLPNTSKTSEELKMIFREWFQIESEYDHGMVKISIDDGNNWTLLSDRSGISEWRKTTINITSYSGKLVRIGFHFTSDDSISYEGWFIDDIQIEVHEPEPFNATMVSLNHQKFPFIYMNVAVDTFSVGFPTLKQSNFKVYENTILQTDYFEVTPPDIGAGVRLADIIFLMDNSGSMSEEINAVSNNVIDFVNNLTSAGVNFALGLCRYGAYQSGGNPIIEDNGILATDANYFKTNVWNRNVVDGGYEPGYYAITQSSNSFSFRPGAQKIFIIITDETPDQGRASLNDALSACTNSHITLFALTESNLYNTFSPITSATNGAYFDIYSNFDDILTYISTQVANNYLVKYKSSNPISDGTLRYVDVIVTYAGNIDTCSSSYIPGSTPIIQRTQATMDLHNNAWSEGTTFNIQADIIDNVIPYVSSARLYYRKTGTSLYNSTNMSLISGSTYRGIIPGGAVRTPGLDYYITATDGQNTASDPSVDPNNNPYQIAILPNVAPQITHTPVTILTAGTPIPITAEITDNTNSLAGAKLYYRKTGQLIYQNIDMTNTFANNYEAEIPVSFVTNDGVDYYIRAWDNFCVNSTRGSADNPIQIPGLAQFAQYITEKEQLINEILGIERPYHGSSHPFYQTTENVALRFVNDVKMAYEGETADPLDIEAVARLALSERVTKQALTDAIDISLYGAKGLKGLTFALIVKYSLNYLSKIIRAIPIFGEPAADQLDHLAKRVEDATTNLTLAFQNGFTMQPQMTLSEYNLAVDVTRKALSSATNRLARKTPEVIDELGLNGSFFDTADHLIQDYLYLNVLEFQTKGTQSDAVQRAQTHLFPRNTFTQAVTDATRTLNDMTASNQAAKEIGNYTDSLNNIAGWVAAIGAFILIVLGLLTAPAGGVVAALAGLATFMVTWGTYVSNTTAIMEAAGAAVHVNIILPYCYLNPSVDDAFGKVPVQEISNEFYLLARQHHANESTSGTSVDPMLNYYSRLREMIISGNAQWATVGIDSLIYFEKQYKEEEIINTARFAAASDSASRIIASYKSVANSYFTKIAARELFTAGLEASAFVYRYGIQTQQTVNTALAAIDSTISVAQKIDNISTVLSAVISQANIPVQPSVGIGEVETSIMSKNQRKAKVEAELINYGTVPVANIQSLLSTPNGVIAGDSIITISLAGASKSKVAFQLSSEDSILVGSILLLHSPNFYSMPGKTFSIDFAKQSPDNLGKVCEGHTYAYPNPFNPESEDVQFRFKLGMDGYITITVYDMSNSKVKEVISAVPMSADVEQSIPWDGRNEQGDIVSNGVYFYVIESSSNERAVGKIAILR